MRRRKVVQVPQNPAQQRSRRNLPCPRQVMPCRTTRRRRAFLAKKYLILKLSPRRGPISPMRHPTLQLLWWLKRTSHFQQNRPQPRRSTPKKRRSLKLNRTSHQLRRLRLKRRRTMKKRKRPQVVPVPSWVARVCPSLQPAHWTPPLLLPKKAILALPNQ